MPHENDRPGEAIEAYLDLWQRNLLAYANEAPLQALLDLARAELEKSATKGAVRPGESA